MGVIRGWREGYQCYQNFHLNKGWIHSELLFPIDTRTYAYDISIYDGAKTYICMNAGFSNSHTHTHSHTHAHEEKFNVKMMSNTYDSYFPNKSMILD